MLSTNLRTAIDQIDNKIHKLEWRKAEYQERLKELEIRESVSMGQNADTSGSVSQTGPYVGAGGVGGLNSYDSGSLNGLFGAYGAITHTPRQKLDLLGEVNDRSRQTGWKWKSDAEEQEFREYLSAPDKELQRLVLDENPFNADDLRWWAKEYGYFVHDAFLKNPYN